jgi:thioredoxin 1
MYFACKQIAFNEVFMLYLPKILQSNVRVMSKPIEINDSNYSEILSSDQPVLVDFWAEWCGPCKMIGPVVEQMAKEYDGKAVIGKVDVDSNPEVSAKFGIRSIPTLLIFKNNEVVDKQIGAVPKAVLVKKLEAQIS